MDIKTYFRAQAYNNAWSNYRLLAACAELSNDALSATRTSFFPSITHTLNHILTVDWFYVSALEGRSIGSAAFDPEIPYTDISEIRAEQERVDRRLIAVCEALDEPAIDGLVHMQRPSRVQVEPVGRTLLHLFQHQIHHRGQVHAMLSGTQAAPPQLDEFFLGDGHEQSFRIEDFRALGFDEIRIWR